jgi:Fe-S oxidoreductase
MLDLHDDGDRRRTREIAVAVAELARECGGVMSGEHGDGRSRGPLLERFFGTELIGAFREIKRLFDPAGILNPGIIVDTGGVETLTENLRVRPGERDLVWPAVETFFDYSDQEGFSGAIEMCNGAGVCRKTAVGTMCPSYRATLEERHSTRGRANALRTALSGQLNAIAPDGRPAWSDPDTIETLDLCLSCKACKSECPSNVDLARLKAEYTAQRFRLTGRVPLAARAIGHIRTLNRLASLAPSLANKLLSLPPLRELANALLKLSPARSLPSFEHSLYAWFAKRTRDAGAADPPHSDAPRVVLFADCFTTYNESAIGRAAVEVLEAFGYRVLLPRVGCCGRSMISTGLLGDAIRTIDRTLAQLQPYIDDPNVIAILVAEPSCLAAIKDEWRSLKLKTPLDRRQRCADKSLMIEDFLDRNWAQHPRIPAALSMSDASARGWSQNGVTEVTPPRRTSTSCSTPWNTSPSTSFEASRRSSAGEAPGSSPASSSISASSAAPDAESTPPVLLHAHCHQKALWGAQTSSNLLIRLLGQRLSVLPSGCCGMAGSFGFTAKHYDVSMTIFNQSLAPHLSAAPAAATILATGTSCRHQIKDATALRAIHPIELIAEMIKAKSVRRP